MRKEYSGLKTTRASVESSPLMEGSKVQLKARKSNTEWQTETRDFTMGSDVDPSAPSRESSQWETSF